MTKPSYLDNYRMVYVLEMYRWGDTENHSYVTGVYTNLKQALLGGIEHMQYRGGKYEPYITMLEIDKNTTHNHICTNKEEALILLREWEDTNVPLEENEE